MDLRPDELFFVDAEQAVRELDQYGSGASDLRLDRLVASLHYFESVLVSIGLEAEAAFSGDFAIAIATMEEGDGRRTVRDFATLVQAQLDAIRQQKLPVNNDDDLDRLRLRFEPMSIAPKELSAPDRLVLDHASRTIAAVDELAANLLRAVKPQTPNDPQGSGETPFEVGTDSQVKNHEPAISGGGVGELMEQSFAECSQIDGESIVEPGLACLQPAGDESSSVGEGQEDGAIDELQVPDSGRFMNRSNSILMAEGAPTQHAQDDERVHLLQLGKTFARSSADALFTKALKVVSTGTWPNGFSSLIEAIDELDQIHLVEQLPDSWTVTGKRAACVNYSLAKVLEDELKLLGQTPTIEVASVACTLLLTLQFDQPARSDRMARLAARFAGRLENSGNNSRWRLVLPASSRLLRVMPLKLHTEWVASSWAQYLDMHQSHTGQIEVKLLLGDVPDRIVVQELGLLSVGVRFDLPAFLRKRDRFRGVVMLSDGRVLPLLG